jgi:N-hydroxyarylamine O-acetyltransferase
MSTADIDGNVDADGNVEVDRYLERLGMQGDSIRSDLDGLTLLQHAHLASVPFENLDIVFAAGVRHDRTAAVAKIIDARRGGWCFELNGAFGALLDALGFRVSLLGAAVLLDGPSTILEHLALEVSGGVGRIEPHFVDVGFGDSTVRPPAHNQGGPQDGGNATFEFFASPQGTTLSEHVDGIPAARLRFKRVAHDFDDFAPIATSMQIDPAKHWSSKPFATRIVDVDSHDRVTLTADRLTIEHAGGTRNERRLERAEWDGVLDDWFGMDRPGPWPKLS